MAVAVAALLAMAVPAAASPAGAAPAPTLSNGPRTPAGLAAYPPGTIVVATGARRLYLVEDGGALRSYRIGVGRMGRQWQGETQIVGKYVHPAWAPPPEVKRDNPRLPRVIPGGAANNPMGARALVLDGEEYAIHGTSARMRASVGTFASYGCFRMLNEDIVDLYDRISVGTPVVVLP